MFLNPLKFSVESYNLLFGFNRTERRCKTSHAAWLISASEHPACATCDICVFLVVRRSSPLMRQTADSNTAQESDNRRQYHAAKSVPRDGDDDDGHTNNAIARCMSVVVGGRHLQSVDVVFDKRRKGDRERRRRSPETLSSRLFPFSSPLFSSALLILELRDWKAVSGVTRER